MNRLLKLGAILLLGMGIGYWLAHHKQHHAPAGHKALARLITPERPAVQAHEELWLADFESEEELTTRWKLRDAVATRAEEHATHGRFAAKVTFTKEEAPAFQMEDYLDSDRQRQDWRGYDAIVFDLYNPQSSQQRVLLQLKDANDHVYKEDIYLSGESSQHISVRLASLKAYLNLAQMKEFTLFRWKPGQASTFYVDAVYLRPPVRSSLPSQSTGPAGVKPTDRWQVTWATGLEKLARDPAKLPGRMNRSIRLALARNEYESFQVVFIGGTQPTHVKVFVGPITAVEGDGHFPSDVVEIHRVEYVETHEPYYPVEYVGKWPDPLPLASDAEIPAGEVQPMWITVGAPESLPAGLYRGTVTASDDAGRTEQLPLEIRVWGFALPRASHLKTAFDFYPFRLKKAYQEFVPGGAKWESRLHELEKLYYLDMLKHRIFPIMGVDPTRESFARSISFYRVLGLTTFGVGSHGGSNGNNWPQKAAELEPLMGWYRRAARALRVQGLLDEAYVYAYDEPKVGDPKVARVMGAIHAADPGLRNLLVLQTTPNPARQAEWLRDVNILCIRIASYDPELAAQFTRLGKEVWMYVSSPSHPFPALVIDYPAMAHRILPWMCWKYHATGLLYWCVNFWKGDPWKDPANFTSDQNGNGSLYYPTAEGPVPSLRMEVLRDGMEDYEYLYRLHELTDQAKAQGGVDPALITEAERLLGVDASLVESLRSYANDPGVLLAQRRAIGDLIEKLQRLVAPKGS